MAVFHLSFRIVLKRQVLILNKGLGKSFIKSPMLIRLLHIYILIKNNKVTIINIVIVICKKTQ